MQISDLVFIDATGFNLSDFPSFQTFVQGIFTGIYGADVYLGSDSQDGQWTTAIAQMAYDSASVSQSAYNSFSPATAQGAGLSRVIKINGLRRGIPTNSQVDLTCVGQANTTVTNGVAKDSLGQLWNLPTFTIPSGGSIVVTAVAQQVGDLSADAGTVTQIYTPTLGWQTVTNVAAAVPGAPVETDAEARIRQANSTANPSMTVLEGTQGALENLTGVTDAVVYENDTGTTDARGIPAYSICAVVEGGSAIDIANTIQLHKTPGVPTFGTTQEQVFDNKGMPNLINFTRPTVATINVQITVASSQGWSNDFVALIQAAVATYISNGGIGSTILITKLFAPAYLSPAQAATFDIVTLQIEKNTGGFGTSNIVLNYNEIPVCAPSNVSVTVT